MNFALFLVLNAILLIRPEELFPEIAGLRLYLIVIVPTVALALPRLRELLTIESLSRRPVAVCVLLFYAASLVTLFVHGRVTEGILDFAPEFGKVVLYYFLLIAIVNTPERFRQFAAAVAVYVCILTAIALAQLRGLVNFPNIEPVLQREWDPVTGEPFWIPRLVSSGIYNDPNDLCLALGLGLLCCLYCSTHSPSGWFGRIGWLLPMPLLIHGMLETHSRGGVLGVLAGGAGYIYSRYGGPKSLPFAAIGAVVALALIGGRQGNIGGGGTAHERLMMWAYGVTMLLNQPHFIPTGLGNGWFIEEQGLMAHNSFVQGYVEFGLFGGGAFMAAFYLAVRHSDRLGRGIPAPAWAVGSRHFAFAVIAAYAIGAYSVSRNHVIPTYLSLGIASVVLETAAATLPERFRVRAAWFKWLVVFSICGLIFVKFSTQGLGIAGV